MSNVLVVDDDEAMCGLICLHLERAGHTVTVAHNSFGAMALATGRPAPDLVVLDVMMPGGSGLELLSMMRALPWLASVPAVFLSGATSAADIVGGGQLGAVYLTKPLVGSALLATVARLLAG